MAARRKDQAPLALFDLDFTLLPQDTLFLFANQVIRHQPWRIYYLLFFVPAVFLHQAGLLSTVGLKRAFLSLLWRLPGSEVERLATKLARRSVRPALYDFVEEHLAECRGLGMRLVLVTASPDLYSEAIARELGFDFCLASRFERSTRMPLFPRARGPNNKGERKTEALQQLFPDIGPAGDTPRKNWRAYSDSSADLPMLAMAEHCYVVHPGKRLQGIAVDSRWTILTPARPYSSRVALIWMLLRQLCGLYKIP